MTGSPLDAGNLVTHEIPRTSPGRIRGHAFTAALQLALLLLPATFLTPALAQNASPNGLLRSHSGQFVVTRYESTPGRQPPSSQASTNSALIPLEPATLAITAERVRQALLKELLQPDFWQARVYVVIDNRLPQNSPALIGATRFTQGWRYQIELPNSIEPLKLVRGLTQVLLLEFANRSQPSRSAEIPLWLSEGLTQQILHQSLFDLVVRPPTQNSRPVVGPGGVTAGRFRESTDQQVGYYPLAAARERLSTHAALSFTRMAEVATEDLASETWLTFQASSHAFVNQLLEIPGGRLALANLLQTLPYTLNWQTAFFNSFQPRFVRTLDVEKWWSVVLVQLTGQNPLAAWSLQTAHDKIDQILLVPVLLPDSNDKLARRKSVSVQQIIQNWEFLAQQNLLQGVLNQLRICRFKVPPEMLELHDAYISTIDDYLSKRAVVGRARSLPGLPASTADLLVKDTVQRLDGLDSQRRQSSAPVENSQPTSTAE